jgi:hypothetical protein
MDPLMLAAVVVVGTTGLVLLGVWRLVCDYLDEEE